MKRSHIFCECWLFGISTHAARFKSPLGAAYMRQWIESALVQIMACRLFGAMPFMMTSSNGNIFRVTGHLWGEFTGPGEFPAQRPVARCFDVFFDLRLNRRLSKQSWGWWFETISRSLWRHRNDYLNQCWNIVNWKLQWNFNRIVTKRIGENAFEICRLWDGGHFVSVSTW